MAFLEVVAAQASNSTKLDFNLIFNLITVTLLVIGAPRIFFATRAKSLLAEKDTVIDTHEQTISAKNNHIETLEQDRRGAREAAKAANIELKRATVEAATWQSRYEEQSKYTAEAALTTITSMMENAEREAQRRHEELMETLGKITIIERSHNE